MADIQPVPAGENDESYYDSSLGQPGAEGPAGAGLAVLSQNGMIWSIAGGTSARVHFGPVTVTSGMFITTPPVQPAEGLVKTCYVSVDGGSKQEISSLNDPTNIAGTLDYYVLLEQE